MKQKQDNMFRKSSELLQRALKVIPGGSQTFSKSHIIYPKGHTPLFLKYGKGGRVWDVDGNEFIDLVCGLLPVLLGYRDPDVDRAINEQIQNGISFSLPTELEIQLAEKLIEIIPCAEMVRFGKNGTDVTSAAVRLARAITGRDHIVVCGYHGWQDWYVGITVRNRGVPRVVQQLTHPIEYGNIEAFKNILDTYPANVAAIIMEPMNISEPPAGYLQEMKELANRHGALFIFDEVITGFRYSLGGAQELFGVTPDLACFGKGLGNGMPISAIVGKAEYMSLFDEVFFSGTFGGEALSLSAAIAVIKKLEREPVIKHLHSFGEQLNTLLNGLLVKYGLQEVIKLVGRPCWTILDIYDHPTADKNVIKTFLIIRCARKGILSSGSHNICYAHNQLDLEHVFNGYSKIFGSLASHLADGDLLKVLGCEPVYPVFSVRSLQKN